MTRMARRKFLTVAGASGAALLLHTPTATALDAAMRRSARAMRSVAGTTIEQAAVAVRSGEAYTRLTAGPGWPVIVRQDLARARPNRFDTREELTSFVQFTDMHMTDAQCPVRFEYVHPFIGSAHRPQETLGPVSTVALVNRVNRLRRGPHTGRPFDFMMTTGDNTDNQEHAELDWFLGILNGGEVTPNTGDPDRYEGVQDSGSSHYWNPGTELDDDYTDKGFPQLPHLLDTAIASFESPGLDIPWYCTFGNHDNTPVGTLPSGLPGMEHFYTGSYKVIGKDESSAKRIAARLQEAQPSLDPSDLFSGGTIREVTPDERRQPFSMAQFVQAHLEPANTGPGPVGHGFNSNNADGRDVYYTFRIAPEITGISLDTTTLGGGADGSIGLGQYRWVEQTLQRSSSRYYDRSGELVEQDVTDEMFVLFSHHTSDTMGNPAPDRRYPLEPRLSGEQFVSLLSRFPNVLCWVNGHTHSNNITAHPGDGDGGFWEINTASHIDFPQLARAIEIADNDDGTLSVLTTLIEADSPYSADYDDTELPALASLYRELSYNDLHAEHDSVGQPADRNAELLLPHPLR